MPPKHKPVATAGGGSRGRGRGRGRGRTGRTIPYGGEQPPLGIATASSENDPIDPAPPVIPINVSSGRFVVPSPAVGRHEGADSDSKGGELMVVSAQPESFPGEDMVEVSIGQRPFYIGKGPAADERRRAHFSGSHIASLVKGEQEIIEYFGIDAYGRANPFMVAFFKNLPNCASDTKEFLKDKCQSVYQTLWMTKMSRTQRAQTALDSDIARLVGYGGDTSAMDLAQLNTLFQLAPRDIMTAHIRDLADRSGIPVQ
jgi:hypothetical protein